jgi:hypothetical protein
VCAVPRDGGGGGVRKGVKEVKKAKEVRKGVKKGASP